ncbi:MAG: hypothetical protein CL912_31000 [Deltaproteobacteria bacterium]|nr:hypothetical protein [Deltaproteobacteria bacterium]
MEERVAGEVGAEVEMHFFWGGGVVVCFVLLVEFWIYGGKSGWIERSVLGLGGCGTIEEGEEWVELILGGWYLYFRGKRLNCRR